MPDEARRMGLTHHVPEGALLDFAARLDSSRPYHRAVAWVMLAVFGLPVIFYVIQLIEDLPVH
jgi:thiosulfate reductase cytochrome b subunit